jgi:hypothetical protein
MISLDQCEQRWLYHIYSRNLLLGIVDGHFGGFLGVREKFDSLFLFTESHRDCGGTVTPIANWRACPRNLRSWRGTPFAAFAKSPNRIMNAIR